MRYLFLLVALAFGCGTTQSSVGPAPEALTEGFPPPHPAQQRPDKEGKCHLPESWPVLPWIVQRGGCWTPLDATQAQCAEANRENPYHVWHEGKCWYPLPGGRKKREPTSSLLPREEP